LKVFQFQKIKKIVDWDLVRLSGIRFALIKATSGLKSDLKFSDNWKSAKSVSIKRSPMH